MDGKSTAQPSASAAGASEERIESWAGEIAAAQKKVNNLSVPGWILLVLAVGSLVVLRSLGSSAYILAAVVAIGAALVVVLAGRSRKGAIARLTGEIEGAIENERLAKEEVVKALSARTKGRVSAQVLAAVDPTTVAFISIHNRGEKLLGQLRASKESLLHFKVSTASGSVTAVTLNGEATIDGYALLAADCVANREYAEGIAALAMVGTMCSDVVMPSLELFTQAGLNLNSLLEVAKAANRIFSGFDFKPEMTSIVQVLAKRRVQSVLEVLRQAGAQKAGLEGAALASVLDTTALRTRDEALVGACIEYMGGKAGSTTQPVRRFRLYELLSQIPDARIVPHVVKAFSHITFFPKGIEGLNLVGEESHAALRDAVQTGSGSTRFNAALALGFMKVTAARPELEAMLPTVTSSMERAGVCYALVRLGASEHLRTLVELLGDPDADARHAAAISLEHVEEPLSDETYLAHMADQSMLVRLRLTRRLDLQGTDNPALVEALVQRLDDSDETVREAAVEALGGLKAEGVYDRMVTLARTATGNSRRGAYAVLGKLSRPGAAPVLTEALKGSAAKDDRMALFSALGDLGVAEAADQIGSHLGDDDLSSAAFSALLRISLKDKEAGIRPLKKRSKDRVRLLFLQALHGDQPAKDQLGRMLVRGTEFSSLIEALDFARILREPAYADRLRGLLGYRNHAHFPGDRYVSYGALKALVGAELAKQA